jgi:hypothetical protein
MIGKHTSYRAGKILCNGRNYVFKRPREVPCVFYYGAAEDSLEILLGNWTKVLPYKEIRGKKFYKQKRVEVIYVTV